MEDNIAQRLLGLSKRQLIATISAIVDKCGQNSVATDALKIFLDSIPPPKGSNGASSGTSKDVGVDVGAVEMSNSEADLTSDSKKQPSNTSFDMSK